MQTFGQDQATQGVKTDAEIKPGIKEKEVAAGYFQRLKIRLKIFFFPQPIERMKREDSHTYTAAGKGKTNVEIKQGKKEKEVTAGIISIPEYIQQLKIFLSSKTSATELFNRQYLFNELKTELDFLIAQFDGIKIESVKRRLFFEDKEKKEEKKSNSGEVKKTKEEIKKAEKFSKNLVGTTKDIILETQYFVIDAFFSSKNQAIENEVEFQLQMSGYEERLQKKVNKKFKEMDDYLKRLNAICRMVEWPVLLTQQQEKRKIFESEKNELHKRIPHAAIPAFNILMKQSFAGKILADKRLTDHLHDNLTTAHFLMTNVIRLLDQAKLLSESVVRNVLADPNKMVALHLLINQFRIDINTALDKVKSDNFVMNICLLNDNHLLNKTTLSLIISNTPYFAEALLACDVAYPKVFTKVFTKENLIEKWQELINKNNKDSKEVDQKNNKIHLAMVKLYQHNKLTEETIAFLRHQEPEKMQERNRTPSSDYFSRQAAYLFAKDILEEKKSMIFALQHQSRSTLEVPATPDSTPNSISNVVSSPGAEEVSQSQIATPLLERYPSHSQNEPSPVRQRALSLETLSNDSEANKLEAVIRSHRSKDKDKGFTTLTKKQFEAALAKYENRRGKFFRTMVQSEQTINLIRDLKKHFQLHDIYVFTNSQHDYLLPKLKSESLGKHLNFFNNKQKAFSQALSLEMALSLPKVG